MRFLVSLFKTILATITKSSTLEIYTDGSCKNGVGSWAYVISRRQKIKSEKSGRIEPANSNVMELQAAIEALSTMPVESAATLYSDSRILIDAMKLGFGPRAYQAQIATLLGLAQERKINWQWVKSHSGNRLNERCDELCILARTSHL